MVEDFLDEIFRERAKRNPTFTDLVREAEERRKTGHEVWRAFFQGNPAYPKKGLDGAKERR